MNDSSQREYKKLRLKPDSSSQRVQVFLLSEYFLTQQYGTALQISSFWTKLPEVAMEEG